MTKKHPNIEHCDVIVTYVDNAVKHLDRSEHISATSSLICALQHVEQVLRSHYEPVDVEEPCSICDGDKIVPGGERGEIMEPCDCVTEDHDPEHDFVRVYHDDDAGVWCLQLRRDGRDTIIGEGQFQSTINPLARNLAKALNIDFVEG